VDDDAPASSRAALLTTKPGRAPAAWTAPFTSSGTSPTTTQDTPAATTRPCHTHRPALAVHAPAVSTVPPMSRTPCSTKAVFITAWLGEQMRGVQVSAPRSLM
jgi:hypothetical protein